ncbi:MAG: DivIVA domain-containing protein [Clostridia bacterium]|nr:DivIVA domain-containing protein [Clostridia bacterium]
MMTPLEIENKKFKKSLSGYNKAEVDEFFAVVSENYEILYKENLANRDKINMLSSAIKQYKAMEETLQSAILVAQSAGDEVVSNAKKRAENIIGEAETKATQMLSDASREVTRISFEYEEMKRNVEVFRTRIISLLTSQLDIVKEFSMPENKMSADELKVESATMEDVPQEAEKTDEFLSAIEQLERVTMELPKIVLNDKGEYVAAEDEDEKPLTEE